MTRRGRVARIQRCIKDNNTLYRNEISTLRRLMPADIHDTVPCTKRPPLSQHNVSSEILYGAERSLTILIFSSFGRTLYLKFDRFDRSRVLSRALLSRKYPIFEREGERGKKKKGKNRNETTVNFQHETRFYSLRLSPSFSAWSTCLGTIVLFSFRRRTAERNYPRKYVGSAGYSSRRSIETTLDTRLDS